MGKVEIRRTKIINYLNEHENVTRQELWLNFGISENRLCEDIKALKVNGYNFDTSKPGYISLIDAGNNTMANIYEPITTSVIRKWILIAWVSMCSDLRDDSHAEKNEHVGQKIVYSALCKFYDYIYQKNDEKKFVYKLNTFHRDVREVCMVGELSHSLMHHFNRFEEKDLFRLSSKPCLIALTDELTEKILFVLDNLNSSEILQHGSKKRFSQRQSIIDSFRKKIEVAYSDASDGFEMTEPIYTNPAITNVYDRLSILVAVTSIKGHIDIELIAKITGFPKEQIQKDLTTFCHNNIGRRLLNKKGFRTEVFIDNISDISNIKSMYYGKKRRIVFLSMDEYQLFKEIRIVPFIAPNDYYYSSLLYKANKQWYEAMEELWEMKDY